MEIVSDKEWNDISCPLELGQDMSTKLDVYKTLAKYHNTMKYRNVVLQKYINK